jgi:hypothetical protein
LSRLRALSMVLAGWDLLLEEEVEEEEEEGS